MMMTMTVVRTRRTDGWVQGSQPIKRPEYLLTSYLLASAALLRISHSIEASDGESADAL